MPRLLRRQSPDGRPACRGRHQLDLDTTSRTAALHLLLESRLERAEGRAVHAEVLARWQRGQIASKRARRLKDVTHAEAILDVLLEYRDWYAEMARQAASDIRFLQRNPSGNEPSGNEADGRAGGTPLGGDASGLTS